MSTDAREISLWPTRPLGATTGHSRRTTACILAVGVCLLGGSLWGMDWTVISSGDSGPNTLRRVVEVAESGDRILFGDHLSGTVIRLSSEIVIVDKDLVIDARTLSDGITLSGDAGVEEDVSDNVRIFRLAGTADLTLHAMTLRDGNSAGNPSAVNGGAVLGGAQAELDLRDCRLIGNRASQRGGAVSMDGSLSALRTQFAGNRAGIAGGAVRNGSGLSASLTDCVLERNTAGNNGGAILNTVGANLNARRCLFSHNDALTQRGGVIITDVDSRVAFTNCTLAYNSCGTNGGAITMLRDAEVTLKQCTVYGNHAGGGGGGVRNTSGGLLFLGNSVIAGNRAGTEANDIDGSLNGAFGVDFVGDPAGASGTGTSLSGDPRLGPLIDNGGETRTMLPLADSPLVDAGRVFGVEVFEDQRGRSRSENGLGPPAGSVAPDIGAVEVHRPIVVDDPTDERNASGAGDTSLREAIAIARQNNWHRIVIDPVLSGQTIQLREVNGAKQLLIISGEIVIDGSSLEEPLTIRGANGARLFEIVDRSSTSDTTMAFYGISFEGGAPDSGSGGAAWVHEGACASFAGCRFVGNRSELGGAVAATGSIDPDDRTAVALADCVLRENEAVNDAGAIYANDVPCDIRRCSFVDNSAQSGGAAWLRDFRPATVEDVTLDSCSFHGNSASLEGGAILADNARVRLANCTLTGNVAARFGGAVMVDGSGELTLEHGTVAANEVNVLRGGGIAIRSGTLVLSNSIVAENVAGLQPDLALFNSPEACVVAMGENLIGVNASVEDVFPEGSRAGTTASPRDPRLVPLADHGGPTLTMPPSRFSLARSAAEVFEVRVRFDQRGVLRSRGAPDLGAVELLESGEANDADGDGIDDRREALFALDPGNPDDGALDRDGDGVTNREELENRTSPRDRLWRPGLLAVEFLGYDGERPQVRFTWSSFPGFEYELELSPTVDFENGPRAQIEKEGDGDDFTTSEVVTFAEPVLFGRVLLRR